MQSASSRFLDRSTPPHIATLILLTALSTMGMNVFLPSLPGMSEYFGTEYRILQLSVGIYLGASAALQILIGPISDQMGRRPVLLWGLFFFMLATLGCLFAPNATVFLLFRMCQAMVAVGMVLGRAAVRDMYDTEKAASMIGYVTMVMALVPMAAPAIGGYLDQAFGWKANFWLLFGAGALVWLVTWLDFRETKSRSGLTIGQQFAQYPELFRSPRFWGYTVTAALVSGAFFAYLGGGPFVGSQVFGMAPGTVGLFLGAPAVGYAVGNGLSGLLSQRIGTNRMIMMGCAVAAFGVGASLLLFLTGYGSAYIFFGFMTFVGLGNGMTLPNATAGMMSVRPHLAGTASGLGGAIMLAGGATLSILAGNLLTLESGPFPLLWMMFTTSVLGLVTMSFVMLRERQVRRAAGQ